MANSNLIQSVQRALDILAQVGEHEQGIALCELAASLHMKAPTAHNLARTLKAKGFIIQKSGARYVLGPALFELTSRHMQSRLIAAAERALRAMFVQMNRKAIVLFSEVIGGAIQTSLRMSPDQPAIMQKPRRQILNPYTSLTALVFHAYASAADREAMAARYPFQEYAGITAEAHDVFTALVKETRKRGYALASKTGRLSAAAPILGVSNELAGIVGLTLINPDGRQIKGADQKAAIKLMLATAASIAGAGAFHDDAAG